MTRYVVGLAMLVMLADVTAAAEGQPGEGEIAVLDLRPVQRGDTDLDRLPEAVAITRKLRGAFARATGRKVWSSADLRSYLGPNWRVLAFNCAEQLSCLRPIFSRLARYGLARVVLGTLTTRRSGATVELSVVNARTLTKERTSSFAVGAEGISDAALADAVAMVAETSDKVGTTTRPAPPKPPAPSEPAPGPIEDTGGDVVETVGSGDDLRTPTPPPPPPSPDRFQLNGWVRTLLDIPFYSGDYYQNTPDAYAVPHDQLIIRSQILIRARYSRGKWFEAAVAGALGYYLFEQNPPDRGTTFNLFNGQSSRGEVDASLREVYVGFYVKRFELRLGQQRVAWGRADFNSPNDVINAHDLRDPLLDDVEIRHIPTPVVRGDVDLGFGTLELVISPFFTPDHFDVYGTNWALVQQDAPAPLRGFLGALTRGLDPPLQAALTSALAASGLPRLNFTDPSAGLRFAWSVRRLDASLYYHYGFDNTPNIVLDPQAAQVLATTDFNAVPPGAAIAMAFGSSQKLPLTISYVRNHHAGADAATTLGPLVLRLDIGWDSNRVFLRQDLTGFQSGALAGVLAVEYQGGDLDKLILVEASYQRVLDAPNAPLLFYDRDSYGVSALARWIFARHLLLEFRGIVGIQPFSYALRSEVGLKFGALTMKVGTLALGGDQFSFGSYYRRNSSVYTLVRYSF